MVSNFKGAMSSLIFGTSDFRNLGTRNPYVAKKLLVRCQRTIRTVDDHDTTYIECLTSAQRDVEHVLLGIENVDDCMVLALRIFGY